MSRDGARVNGRISEALKRKADNSPYTITEMIKYGIESHVEDEMKIKTDLEKSSAELERRKDELRRAREEYNDALDTVERQARQLREMEAESGDYDEWLDDLLDRADGNARIRLNKDVILAQGERELYDKTVEDVKVDLRKRAIRQERNIKDSQFENGNTESRHSDPSLHTVYRIDDDGDIAEREQEQQHTTDETISTDIWTIEEVEQFIENGWSMDDVNWENVDGSPDDVDSQYLDAEPVEASTAD